MEIHPRSRPFPAAAAGPYAPPLTDPLPPARAASSLVQAVQAGHRYYKIPYVMSVVVITFRRDMGNRAYLVTDGQWPVFRLIVAALLTGFVGPWSFPWGFAYSIATLIQLSSGGADFTGEMLKEEVGPEEARRILASAPKPVKQPAFWLVRLAVLASAAPAAWIIFFVAKVVIKAAA